MSYDPPYLPPAEELAARRAAVFERLGDGVMVLPAAPVAFRSRDTETRYRPDSELYYLTGCSEPGALAVLVGGGRPRFELFVLPRDQEAELWGGARLGPDTAGEQLAADAAHPTTETPRLLPQLMKAADRLHYRERHGDGVGEFVREALRDARRKGARDGTGARGLIDPGEILDELRMRKSTYEIERLRSASMLSVAGHRAGADAIGPGVGEWVVEAEIEAAFRRGGASAPGFPTIVGSGANACVLHYVRNCATLEEGDLVLVDAGAELDMYCGDITRTYPAGGGFTVEQRRVYDVVERARAAAVAKVEPGATIGAVHAAAAEVITEGLLELGVLTGDFEDLLAGDAHKPFYPHHTSHWLGIDVHDPGDYSLAGASRALEPGMVFTIEPGLYFRPALCEGGAAAYAGIGVRIEDDVVVTEDGVEVLTAGLPTDADAVAELVQKP